MALAEQRDQHQFDRLAFADDHPLDVGDDPIGDLFDRLHSVASSLSFRANTLRQYTTSPNYESKYICPAYLCHNPRCSTMIESYNPGTCIQISSQEKGAPMRRLFIFVIFAMFLAACGAADSSAAPASTAARPPATAAPTPETGPCGPA